MAIIRPFSAYRPAPGREDKIAALPYDVYNRREAVEEVKRHPESFLAIDRAETFFDDRVDMYDPVVYDKAAEILKQWILEGRFIREKKPCYYLYELIMDGRSQTGIVACASIDDYQNSRIKKHENTRADKELDRIRHVDTCNMQTGPIFLTYKTSDILRQIISAVKENAPLYDFVSEDGITHRVWIVDTDERIETIYHAFEKMNAIYIADGHHRCASAVKVGLKRREADSRYCGEEEYNYFLSVLFPDEELKIMDYNRVIKDFNGLSREEFLTRISQSFHVEEMGEEAYRPEKKASYGMYDGEKWYKLTALDNIRSDDPVKGLDVSILQDYLLDPILGIKDPKVDKRIDFVGGIRGLQELEKRVHSDMKIAFSLYPTSIEELERVADAGMLMPPKSTWFEPKLRSGLFLHALSE